MVDNIIVATFSNVNAAHNAAKAIGDLTKADGTHLKLKSGVILTKDAHGDVSCLSLKSTSSMEPRSALLLAD